jgi:RNA polymerase sigma-70 factor (ECF subfamily)
VEIYLLKRIKDGDHLALEELYKTYGEYALRTAAAVSGSSSAAADIVQETFIRIFYKMDSFDIDKPFKPWFYRILLNECYRYLRGWKKTLFIEDYKMPLYEVVPENGYKFEEFEELYAAIKKLNDRNRIPLILKYLSGFREDEIALVLGIKLNTVKSRLFKARQKLKKLLQGYYERRIYDV